MARYIQSVYVLDARCILSHLDDKRFGKNEAQSSSAKLKFIRGLFSFYLVICISVETMTSRQLQTV